MKDNPASAFVKITLNVPRGLWELLNKMQYLTNEAPKEYLEKNVLAQELECILSHIPKHVPCEVPPGKIWGRKRRLQVE